MMAQMVRRQKRHGFTARSLAVLGIAALGLIGVLLIRGLRAPTTEPANPIPVAETPSEDPPSPNLGRVTGRVTRRGSAEPLSDVVVEFILSQNEPVAARTNKEGYYEVSLTPGLYAIRASLEGMWRPQDHESAWEVTGRAAQTLDIQLDVGPRISGVVKTWDNKLLSKIQIQVAWRTGPKIIESHECPVGRGGEFSVLLKRAKGNSTLFVSAEGYQTAGPVPLKLDPSEDIVGIEIILNGGRSVEGTASDDAGVPVSGAKIQLVHEESRILRPETTSSVNGRFNFSNLRQGPYRILVDAKGYARTPEPDRISISKEGVQELALTVFREWSIKGVIQDSSGHPVKGCPVSVRESGAEYFGKSNAEGKFSVDKIKPGKQDSKSNRHSGIDSVMCIPKKLAPAVYRDVNPYGGDIIFTLVTGGSLEVRVRLSDQEIPNDFPWSGIVELHEGLSPTDQSAKFARYMFEGKGSKTLIPRLTPGFYDVSVDAVGRARSTRTRIAITSGATSHIDMSLRPGKPTLVSLSYEISPKTSPEDFRKQIRHFLQHAEPDLKEILIEGLLDETEQFPALREVVEELIKQH